jgi:hypothetical protein
VRDFLVVPHSHPFIMRPRMVHEQIFHFLEHGMFARSTAPNLVPGSPWPGTLSPGFARRTNA